MVAWRDPGFEAVSDERGPRVRDADFSAQKPGAVASPWYFANIGGTGIRGEIVAEGDAKCFRLTMGRATSNFESAQLWQHADLRPGARYTIRARRLRAERQGASRRAHGNIRRAETDCELK